MKMNDSGDNLYNLKELKLIKAEILANFADMNNVQPVGDMNLKSLFTQLNSVLHGENQMNMCYYFKTAATMLCFEYTKINPTGRWKLVYSPNDYIKEDHSPILYIEHRGNKGIEWIDETRFLYDRESFEYINESPR